MLQFYTVNFLYVFFNSLKWQLVISFRLHQVFPISQIPYSTGPWPQFQKARKIPEDIQFLSKILNLFILLSEVKKTFLTSGTYTSIRYTYLKLACLYVNQIGPSYHNRIFD